MKQSRIESNAEFLLGIEKAGKEIQALIGDKPKLTPKEAFEVWEYARSRTRLNVDLEELTGEETAWRRIFEETDNQIAIMLGPTKKAEMDSLIQQRDTAQAVADALDRLASEPWWKRNWIAFRIGILKFYLKILKAFSGQP